VDEAALETKRPLVELDGPHHIRDVENGVGEFHDLKAEVMAIKTDRFFAAQYRKQSVIELDLAIQRRRERPCELGWRRPERRLPRPSFWGFFFAPMLFSS
jgi:hypothetical protein